MKNKDIEERFNELVSNDSFICTQDEFDNFQNFGYLIPTGKSYLTRLGKKVNIEIIKQKTHIMNINLTAIIDNAVKMSREYKCKRIYCMSDKTYNSYIEKGSILEKDGNKYYRVSNNELWLIMLI